MDPVTRQYLKGLVYGGGIIATGVLLYKYATPSEEQLIARFSPEVRAEYEKNKALRQKEQEELIEIVKRTSSSDKPIWKTDKIGSPFEKDSRGMDPKLVDFRKFEQEKAEIYQQEQLKKSELELREAQELLNKTNQKSWWKFW